MGDVATLSLLVVLDPGPDADEADLERATRRLRAELTALDVDSVQSVRGAPPPAGAKGLDVSLGALLVALSASGGVFVTLLGTVRDWLGRQPGGHKVSITVGGETLELEAATTGEQRALVDAFVARHSGDSVPRRVALVIATYQYDDLGLSRLTAPAHDAEALAAVLGDRDIAGFEVTTLINQPMQKVGKAISAFYRERSVNDLPLLYFSGHGLKDESGRLYLAMQDTMRDDLMFTGLSADLVDRAMEECNSRQKVLILDCCYSGAFPSGLTKGGGDTETHALAKFSGRGRTVLTASDSAQYSFEGEPIGGEVPQSVFTRYLVQGLRDGSADLDDDGDITIDELYSYVHERVVKDVPNQRPKKQADVEGRTVIARNINWTLPVYVSHGIGSPLAADRQSALDLLIRRWETGNATVRARALDEIEKLAADDSRVVSAKATEWLAARAAAKTRKVEALPVAPPPAAAPPPTPPPPVIAQPVPPPPPPSVGVTPTVAASPVPGPRLRAGATIGAAAAVVLVIAVASVAASKRGGGGDGSDDSSTGSSNPVATASESPSESASPTATTTPDAPPMFTPVPTPTPAPPWEAPAPVEDEWNCDTRIVGGKSFDGELSTANITRRRDVWHAQKALVGLGHLNLSSAKDASCDGLFGKETFQAVEKFQVSRGLDKTGAVDQRTWGCLIDLHCRDQRSPAVEAPGPTPSPSPTPTPTPTPSPIPTPTRTFIPIGGSAIEVRDG